MKSKQNLSAGMLPVQMNNTLYFLCEFNAITSFSWTCNPCRNVSSRTNRIKHIAHGFGGSFL